MSQRRVGLAAIALFVLLYLLPLGFRPLFVPDETRYAEIPREMLASGNWLVPHLNGLRYYEKPVLGYWLNALSIQLFGANGFAIRLPSALATGLAALLLFWLARRYCRQAPLVAPLSALVFLSCFAVVGIGTFAVLDAMLAFFLTGALVFFFAALAAPSRSRQERGWLAAAGLFCGLAFLAKGFLAFAVPALTVGGYLVWQRRFRDLARLPWLPLAVAVAVALPWSVMIQRRAPDFWQFFIWNEHIRRFLGDNAQHGQPVWFFLAVAPAMSLPWALLVPAALAGRARHVAPVDHPANDLARFALCWLVLPFGFFSACHGKLITYILPCFPPFALLMAIGFDRGLGTPAGDRRFRRAAGFGAVLFGLLLAAFLGVQAVGINGFHPYVHTWKWLMIANGLGVMAFLLIVAARCREKSGRLLAVGFAPALLLFSLQVALPQRTLEAKAPVTLLARHRHDVRAETVLLSGENAAATACWVFKRDDVLLVERAGELDYGVARARPRERLLTPARAGEVLRENRGHAVLVAAADEYARWQASLPVPVSLDGNGPHGYVLAVY